MEIVEDLLSGETLFSANTKDSVVVEVMFVDKAFDFVMNNASEPPLELREAMESFQKSQKEKEVSTPQSAPPSGAAPATLPADFFSSKHPPKSPPPSGQ